MEADIKKRRSRLAMLVKRPVEIPELLIYEIMDGRLIYYKGHREVLAGRKTIEEVHGIKYITMGAGIIFHANHVSHTGREKVLVCV